ncbi:MAG: lipoprotein [Pseudonocardia sp.]|nr:lipoprotein [Pseudonocardia sp.]
MRERRAFGLIGAGLVVASLALAGCSTSVSGNASGTADLPSSSAASTTTTSTAPSSTKCVAGQLQGSLQEGSPGAGQRYATLVVKNTSTTTCTLFGYGGLGLYLTSGTPLPTDAQRVLQPGPASISLAPGETARENLQWTVVPTGTEGNPCQPTPEQLRVIPPDDTKQISIVWTYGPVCNKGRIDESAFYK